MRLRLLTFLSHYQFWFLLAFVCLNAALLLILYRHNTVPYPTGWDAPYYINRIRELLERGIIPQRFGFVGVVSLIHLVTRMPVMTIISWASPALMVLTAAGVASLVFAATRRSLTAFAITFLVALWSPLNVLLSTGTFDNAFAVALLFAALWMFLWKGPTWRRGIVLMVTAMIIGGTHIETYTLFLFIATIYQILQIYWYRSFRRWLMSEFDIMAAIALGVLVAVWHWAGILSRLVTTYSNTADSNGNASIPYAQSSTLTSVITYLKTGIQNDTTLWIVLAGLVVLGYRVVRRYDRAANLLMAYVLAGYAVLLFAVFRGSIPINRAIPIIPVNALIGFGIYCIARLPKRIWPFTGALVVISSYLIFATPTAFVATINRLSPSISPTTFAAYQSLATYVRAHSIKTYVVVADISAGELAASAYYSLWTNWLTATRPVGTTTDQYCIYLGSLQNYYDRVPTIRSDRREYNETTLEGQRCASALVKAFPEEAPTIFVIQGIYFASFPQPAWSAVKEVAPNVGIISQPPLMVNPVDQSVAPAPP